MILKSRFNIEIEIWYWNRDLILKSRFYFLNKGSSLTKLRFYTEIKIWQREKGWYSSASIRFYFTYAAIFKKLRTLTQVATDCCATKITWILILYIVPHYPIWIVHVKYSNYSGTRTEVKTLFQPLYWMILNFLTWW